MFKIDEIINRKMLRQKITLSELESTGIVQTSVTAEQRKFTQTFRVILDPDSGAWRPETKL